MAKTFGDERVQVPANLLVRPVKDGVAVGLPRLSPHPRVRGRPRLAPNAFRRGVPGLPRGPRSAPDRIMARPAVRPRVVSPVGRGAVGRREIVLLDKNGFRWSRWPLLLSAGLRRACRVEVLDGGLIPPGGLDNFKNGFLPAAYQASILRSGAVPVANIRPADSIAGIQEEKLAFLAKQAKDGRS